MEYKLCTIQTNRYNLQVSQMCTQNFQQLWGGYKINKQKKNPQKGKKSKEKESLKSH
jgi:hypothetical protein